MAEGTSHTHIHQAVSCHTTQVSVLQFDSILTPSPGVSIICHGLRTQPPPQDTPTPLQMPMASHRSPGYPQLLPDLATNQGFPGPLPWVQVN